MLFEIQVEKHLGDAHISADCDSDARLTALIGPSGAGKTSIFNMISGILRPDQGRIVVDGRTLFDSDSGIDVPPELRRCGYVFQDGRLFPHMSVRSNLLYGRNLAPVEAHCIAFEEVVALLGIAHLCDRRPRSLSGGEARRVAIGRALLAGAKVLLMDEPLTSLDRQRRAEMLLAIERLRDHLAIPILYVSHQEDEIARLAGAVIQVTSQPAAVQRELFLAPRD